MSVSTDLKGIIQGAVEGGPKPYDTPAEVVRIDGGTAYVHIPGGVDETPVKMTIACAVGDTVQVRVGGGRAWLTGNATAPPTDDAEAIKAKTTATNAQIAADGAMVNAETARIAANNAVAEAGRAKNAADRAETSATNAQTSANEAIAQAQNAAEYASRALGGLSTVQSVAETLAYITQHGTMTLTTDVALDPTHVYFVQDAGGDYTVGGVTYAVVTEPDVADIATYYELTIDESLQNYVGTHLALTSEGLWLLPATSGTNKVLIATGAGSQYTIAGTYLIDGSNNTVASFRADGATMSAQGVQIAHLGYGAGTNSSGGTSAAPFYTLGIRRSGTVGNYSVAEGNYTEASGYSAHAEGNGTTASGTESHAEGTYTTASGYSAHAEGSNTKALDYYCHAEGYLTEANAYGAHAEGCGTIANGQYCHAEGYETYADYAYSHAQNLGTIATRKSQTSLGSFNVEDTAQTTTHPSGEVEYGQYAVIVGNGTDDNSRSNALTIDWSGNVVADGDITDGSGSVLSDKADSSSLSAVATSGDYDDLSNKPQINSTTLTGNKTFSDLGLIDFFYPVGSYYETSDTSFDPNTSWGGTWVLETEGQVHVSGSASGNYRVGGALSNQSDGGEASHTLTENEMPSHTHTQNQHRHTPPSATYDGFMVYNFSTVNAGFSEVRVSQATSGSRYVPYNSNSGFDASYSMYTAYETATNQNTGGGQAHNNLQPYIVVNRWHRTA